MGIAAILRVHRREREKKGQSTKRDGKKEKETEKAIAFRFLVFVSSGWPPFPKVHKAVGAAAAKRAV